MMYLKFSIHLRFACDDFPTDVKALEIAIDALEKQIVKKPKTNLEKLKAAVQKMDASALAILINDLKYIFRLETYEDFLNLIAYFNGNNPVEDYGRFDGTHCIGFGIKQEREESENETI